MMIRGLLRDSDFLTLLSPDQVALEVDAGMLVAIGRAAAPARSRTIGITTRAGWRPTARAGAVHRSARQAQRRHRLHEN